MNRAIGKHPALAAPYTPWPTYSFAQGAADLYALADVCNLALEFQWRDPREVERVMEQWYATTSIQWLAPECCRVYKSDDGVTARCEIELLGMVGAV